MAGRQKKKNRAECLKYGSLYVSDFVLLLLRTCARHLPTYHLCKAPHPVHASETTPCSTFKRRCQLGPEAVTPNIYRREACCTGRFALFGCEWGRILRILPVFAKNSARIITAYTLLPAVLSIVISYFEHKYWVAGCGLHFINIAKEGRHVIVLKKRSSL